jgi:DNA-binding response OmpR family regulator
MNFLANTLHKRFRPKPQGKGKILIADDSDTLRALYVRILQLDGWETLEARDGREALETIRNVSPDIVLLDNRMPEMLGTEVFAQLRKEGILTPIVFVTSASEVREVAQSLGIKHYLGKPFGPRELHEAIREALHFSGGRK